MKFGSVHCSQPLKSSDQTISLYQSASHCAVKIVVTIFFEPLHQIDYPSVVRFYFSLNNLMLTVNLRATLMIELFASRLNHRFMFGKTYRNKYKMRIIIGLSWQLFVGMLAKQRKTKKTAIF